MIDEKVVHVRTYEVFAQLNQPVSHLMNRIEVNICCVFLKNLVVRTSEVKLQVEPAVQELYLDDLLMDITQPLSTYCREVTLNIAFTSRNGINFEH